MLIYTNIQFDFNTHTHSQPPRRDESMDRNVECQRRCESEKHTHTHTSRPYMDERFWASFQLSLRTNLSIERKSGKWEQAKRCNHPHTHTWKRQKSGVYGKLIRSSVDLFKVYSHSLVCVWMDVCVFIFFVSGDSFPRDSAIFSFCHALCVSV